jgi:small subunit ribosomal protein S20
VANTKSAQKAMRQAERRTLRNRAARSSVRTYVKNATEAVASSSTGAAEVVRVAVRALDKAAQKGIVHRNAAARRKSRLMTRLHRLTVAPPQVEAAPAKAPSRRASTARGGTRTGTRRTTGTGSRTRRTSS